MIEQKKVEDKILRERVVKMFHYIMGTVNRDKKVMVRKRPRTLAGKFLYRLGKVELEEKWTSERFVDVEGFHLELQPMSSDWSGGDVRLLITRDGEMLFSVVETLDIFTYYYHTEYLQHSEWIEQLRQICFNLKEKEMNQPRTCRRCGSENLKETISVKLYRICQDCDYNNGEVMDMTDW